MAGVGGVPRGLGEPRLCPPDPPRSPQRLEVGIRMRIEQETVQRAQSGLPKKLALVTAPAPAKDKAKKGRS